MSASDRLRDALAAAKAQSDRDPTYNPAVCIVPDEVPQPAPDEVRDMLARAVERLDEPAEPDSRERLEARVAELQRRSAVTLTDFLLAPDR